MTVKREKKTCRDYHVRTWIESRRSWLGCKTWICSWCAVWGTGSSSCLPQDTTMAHWWTPAYGGWSNQIDPNSVHAIHHISKSLQSHNKHIPYSIVKDIIIQTRKRGKTRTEMMPLSHPTCTTYPSYLVRLLCYNCYKEDTSQISPKDVMVKRRNHSIH